MISALVFDKGAAASVEIVQLMRSPFFAAAFLFSKSAITS